MTEDERRANVFTRLSNSMYIPVIRNGETVNVLFENLTALELYDLWESDESVVNLAKLMYVIDKLQATQEFLELEGYSQV